MRAALVCVVLALAATAAEAQPVWVSVGGGYLAAEHAFDDALTLEEYLESGRVDGTYESDGGALVDVAVGVGLRRGFALVGGGGIVFGSSDIRLRGEIPHPFFFGQRRGAEHVVTDATRREVSLRAELAWSVPLMRRLQMTLSGGPVAMHVRQGMADGIVIREVGYPFDDVSFAPSAVSDEGAWGLGGTTAAQVAWLASDRAALTLTARFSRAVVTLRDHDVDAGGPAIVAGVRIGLR